MPEDKNVDEDAKRAEACAALIEEHFRSIPYPGDAGVVNIRGEGDLERREIMEAFSGQHWTSISLPVLRYHHESLFFFTPAAFRFYLPAFLRACVLSYDEAENILGSVVFSLTPPEEEGSDDRRFSERVDGLRLEQKRTIAAFLEFLHAEHGEDFPGYELDLLLDRYWAQFK